MRYWKILSVSLATHTPIEQIMSGQGELDSEDAAPKVVRNESSEAYKFALAFADGVAAYLKTGTAQVVRRTRTNKRFRAVPISQLAEGEEVPFWIGSRWMNLDVVLDTSSMSVKSKEQARQIRSDVLSQLVDSSIAERMAPCIPPLAPNDNVQVDSVAFKLPEE